MENNFNVDDFLSDIINPVPKYFGMSLKELFEGRLEGLELTPTNALEILKIQYRTLQGILNGTQKTVDLTSLVKLADFMHVPREVVVELYMREVEKNFPDEVKIDERIRFIKENFDLLALRKAGFIDSITDYDLIEKKINNLFGLNSIFEYKPNLDEVAFSSGRKNKGETSSFKIFKKFAKDLAVSINNPYSYDREGLKNFLIRLKPYSRNVDLGFIEVSRILYKLGITVFFLEPLPTMHIRGATFSSNEKPCIVITDYVGFYGTIWFALVHELYHVLYHWDEINENVFHASLENETEYSTLQKEDEANSFARNFLFSNDQTKASERYMKNESLVSAIAKENDIHPSIIYLFYAYDFGAINKAAWGLAKNKNPKFDNLIKSFQSPWKAINPRIKEIAIHLKSTIYS